MTVGAITFDIGFGTSPFTVTLDDASGLAPLSLPGELAHDSSAPCGEGVPHGPLPEAVRRFESAMNTTTADSSLRVFAAMPMKVENKADPRSGLDAVCDVTPSTPSLAIASNRQVVDSPKLPEAKAAATPTSVEIIPAEGRKQVAAAASAAETPEVVEVAEKPAVVGVGPAVVEERPAVVVEKPVVVVVDTPIVVDERPAVVGAGQIVVESKPVTDGRTIVVEAKPLVEEISQSDSEDVSAAIHAAPVSVAPSADASAPAISPSIAIDPAVTTRTAVIAETVAQIVEAVADQIVVTPALTHGDGNVRIVLKPTVLDGSEISMTAKDGALTVAITPATPESGQLAAAALPRLETALAEHVSAFRQVSVAIVQKKGKANETA